MLRLAENVRSSQTPDGAIILDIRGGRMFTFNATGSRILRMLEAGTAKEEIVLRLIRECSADPATAESDAGDFLAVLQAHGLLAV